MTSTVFTDLVGPAVNAAWLNDVNRGVYVTLPALQTAVNSYSLAPYAAETQVATDGQTVFTLANAYVPGASCLVVYVNGLRWTTSDYVETSANVVTFNSGLVLNDEVTFEVWHFTAIGTAASSNVTYLPAGTGAVATNVQTVLRETVSVTRFGADPTGVADSTAAIQAAINSGAVEIKYPYGTYKVTDLALVSGQRHIGYGATLTSSGTIFAHSTSISNLCVEGLTFAGTGKAFYNTTTAYYANAWTIKNCTFAQSLSECLYETLIASEISNCYFGANIGSIGAQHRHIYALASAASNTAINANLFRDNRFYNAAGGSYAVFLQYGSGNTFLENIFEGNSVQPLHINGGGVTNLIGNWFESNTATNQIYFENTGAISSTIYYNRVINAIGNTANLLIAGNTSLFYLDANSYNLSMVGNQIYTNQAGVYVTQSPAGNNGGIIEYRNNSNYSASFTETGITTTIIPTVSIGSPSGTLQLGTISAGSFTQKAQLDSSGVFQVGTTNKTSHYFSLNSSGGTALGIQNTSANAGSSGIQQYLGAGSNNTSAFHGIFTTNGADKLYLYGNGDIKNTNGVYGTISDANLKTNIEPARRYLSDLRKLEVVKFNWKSDTTAPKQLGLIAQQVETVFPGLIDETPVFAETTTDDITERKPTGEVTKGVKTSVLIHMLLTAVQELSADFESYKASHP